MARIGIFYGYNSNCNHQVGIQNVHITLSGLNRVFERHKLSVNIV